LLARKLIFFEKFSHKDTKEGKREKGKGKREERRGKRGEGRHSL
jgi:hypothetical protein